MKQASLIKFIGGIVIFTILFFAGFGIHALQGSNQSLTGSQTDTLSDSSYNIDSINSDRTNSVAPYFVGFNALIDYGVSNNDLRYIQDIISHYVIYERSILGAKISYNKDSYTQEDNSGTARRYNFSFGINDGNIHTVSVVSDIISRKITITIKNSSGDTYIRNFTLYSF